MKLLYLLPLVVFFVGVGAGKISDQENEQTQMICGRKAGGYSRKVINGEYVKKGEHPWAVSVYVRYYNKKNEFKTLLGPGTMISSRHIVAFNSLFRSTENLNLLGMEDTGIKGICEGGNLILPQELLTRFDADLEYLKDLNGNREFRNTIAKATVINGCKKLLPSNPMILELVAPLENNTVPVCISNSARNWERVGGFSVYGMDRPGRLVSGRFRPIECSASAPFSCAEASNKSSQGLCQISRETSVEAPSLKWIIATSCLDSTPGPQTEAPPTTVVPEEEGTTTAEEEYYTREVLSTHREVPYGKPFTWKPYYTREVSPAEEDHFTHRVLFTNVPRFTHVPHEDPFTFEPPTVPSADTEEIKAETFVPLMISNNSLGDDVIKAETFAPMKIGGGAEVIKSGKFAPMRIGGGGEVIKAEKFEPMEIDQRGSTRANRFRDIHIHIHLNK